MSKLELLRISYGPVSTVGDCTATWMGLVERTLKWSTAKSYRTHVGYLRPLADLPLSELTVEHIESATWLWRKEESRRRQSSRCIAACAPVGQAVRRGHTAHTSSCLEGILHMQLGPVRHTMTEDAAATVLVRRDLVVHDTLTDPDVSEDAAVQTILGQLIADESRTTQICIDVADAHRRGRNVLVFTDRTEHLEALRRQLSSGHGLEPAVLKGGTGKKLHKAILEGLQETNTPILLLATGAYLGEGFDLPALDTLFLTFPISGRSRVVQYVGRVTRSLPGKTSVEVYDYHDSPHPLLRRMHQRRLAALKSIGFTPSASR